MWSTLSLPAKGSYRLTRARVPASVLAQGPALSATPDGLVAVDLAIEGGAIARIAHAGTLAAADADCPALDLHFGMVWPCFVDAHTHLDKGHVWSRSPNPSGTFDGAIAAVVRDQQTFWQAEDLYRRMEFGLKCSYAHGTQALRTHLDCPPELWKLNVEVFAALREAWRDRLQLQWVSLVRPEEFAGEAGERLADGIAANGGILGAVVYMAPDLDDRLDRLFTLAKTRHLDLDFHTDENGDPNSETLRAIAKAALRHEFAGRILCGHCCSLAVQDPARAADTIALVKAANIAIVSLPACNLFLQDRTERGTPRWRGVTLLHELQAAGIPVLLASDNNRDPFHGFGDGDMLETFGLGVRIAHLDLPYDPWVQAVTGRAAAQMGLAGIGTIGVGYPADLVLFRARNYSELLSRPQTDRVVLRRGMAIDTTLPDYTELDDLVPF